MGGFFTSKETQSEARPDGKTYSCASCGLIKEATTPRMKPYGNFKKGILNIGGLPSDMDDKKGKPWQDTTGKYLSKVYAEFGVDLFEDCLNINSINCHTKNSLGSYQVGCCRKTVLKIIREYKPKVIILFGEFALESVVGSKFKKSLGDKNKIDKWRGWTIPDNDYKTWICPMFHPSKVGDATKEVQTIFKKDLKQALDLLDKRFVEYKEPVIETITDLKVLNNLREGAMAFDYETTGLKPHSAGHRIICVSIADSPDHAYVFMMPDSKKEREPFINFLKNPNIGKIAQNMKYEHVWSWIKLKQPVVNWFWDTMLATHIFDNRSSVTGLKFQAYVQFGIADYSSEIENYLKAEDEKNANSINRIMELVNQPHGKEKLMLYCGYDSIYEFRLAVWQRGLLGLETYTNDDLPF